MGLPVRIVSLRDFRRALVFRPVTRFRPGSHPYSFDLPTRQLPLHRPWHMVSVDFIVELPESDGHDAIMVVVDSLTKRAHFLPVNTTITAEGSARQFRSSLPCPTYSWRNPCGIPVFLPLPGRKTGIPQGIMPQPLFIKWL